MTTSKREAILAAVARDGNATANLPADHHYKYFLALSAVFSIL
jgi:hypothetical protein